MLVINNEGVYPIPKTFLHHNQSSDASIIIFKRMDSLKFRVELNNPLEVDWLLLIIIH